MSLSFCFTICHELVHLNPGLILLVIEVRFFDLLSWLTCFVMDFLNRSSKRTLLKLILQNGNRDRFLFFDRPECVITFGVFAALALFRLLMLLPLGELRFRDRLVLLRHGFIHMRYRTPFFLLASRVRRNCSLAYRVLVFFVDVRNV